MPGADRRRRGAASTASSGATRSPSRSAPSGPPRWRMVFAVPVAIGIALFITHYAPRRLAQGLGYVIDLLAAVPSVVFGLWGINTLAPADAPRLRVADRQPRAASRLRLVLRRPGLRHRPHHPDGRRRAGRHGAADHHRHLPRGVPADPAAARGGVAGPRRHPLGDDPPGGAARSAPPASCRRACSASAAPSARRWPSPWCSRPAADHPLPAADLQPTPTPSPATSRWSSPRPTAWASTS